MKKGAWQAPGPCGILVEKQPAARKAADCQKTGKLICKEFFP